MAEGGKRRSRKSKGSKRGGVRRRRGSKKH